MNQPIPLRHNHAADDLAEVRAEIKALEARQEELRQALIAAERYHAALRRRRARRHRHGAATPTSGS
jgi:hypothetical protein